MEIINSLHIFFKFEPGCFVTFIHNSLTYSSNIWRYMSLLLENRNICRWRFNFWKFQSLICFHYLFRNFMWQDAFNLMYRFLILLGSKVSSVYLPLGNQTQFCLHLHMKNNFNWFFAKMWGRARARISLSVPYVAVLNHTKIR